MALGRIPLLPFVATFLAGRVVAEFCPPLEWPVAGVTLLFSIFTLSLAFHLQAASSWTLLGLFAILGYVATPPNPVADGVRFVLLDQDRPGVFEGNVERVQSRPGGRARVTAALTATCFPQGCRPVSGKVVLTFERDPPVEGRTIRFRARLSRLAPDGNPGHPDHVRSLIRQGFVRRGFVAAGNWTPIVHSIGHHRSTRSQNRLTTWLQRVRHRVRCRLEAEFESKLPPEALGLALGLALGDRSRIDETTRTCFSNAGLAHLLAISGTHMALIALGMEILVRNLLLLFPLARRRGLVVIASPTLASVGVTLYAGLVGLTPAMGRALLMGVSALLLRSASRRVDTSALLVFAALVVGVAEPNAIWDVGCQLSFVSVAFLVRLVPAVSRKVRTTMTLFPDGRVKRLTTGLLELLSVSAVATLGTAPLCAYYFQAIPWVGVVANAVAVPIIAGLGLPLVIVSAAASSMGLPGSDVMFALAGTVLRAGIGVAVFFGGKPALSPFRVALSAPWALLLAALTALFLLEVRGRRWIVIGASLAITTLLWWASHPRPSTGQFTVTQLNVGQGDCFVLQFPNGQVAVLDGGGNTNPKVYLEARDAKDGSGVQHTGPDPGKRIIVPYLISQGYDHIDFLMLSHPHPDHLGGLLSLVETMPIAQAWIAELPDRRGLLSLYVDRLLARGVPTTITDADTPAPHIGGVTFHILHPFHGWRTRMRSKRGRSTNNASLVFVATYGRMDMLFTGDMEKEVEALLVASGKVPRVEWVKVPHHGSDTSSTPLLVEATRPKVATISVGRGNQFGFPRRSVVRRWAVAGAAVFRTDRNGAVVFTTDGERLEVHPALEGVKKRYVFEAVDDTPVPTTAETVAIGQL